MKLVLGRSILLILLSLSSCRGYDCYDPSIRASFGSSFDGASLAIFTIEEYDKGTGFKQLRTRKVLGTSIVTGMHDSLAFPLVHGSFSINRDYDTWIKIVSNGKEFKIRDMSIKKEKQPWSLGGEKEHCSNTVFYNLNDHEFEAKGGASEHIVSPAGIVLE